MKLSVVIPVYKVEQTLDKCIRSIVSQQLTDMEIILVDDGSPDSCPAICDRWADKDSRIQVIHKENGGLSDARNAGIEKVKGKYITFVDSDDYLEDGTYPTLLNILSAHPEYDILEYPVNQYEGGTKEQPLSFNNHVYADAKDYWYTTSAYLHTYAWNKIYKKDLFHNIRFPVGKVFEDVYTFPLILNTAKTIATTSEGLYHYCFNQEGITFKANGNAWRMLLDAHVIILNTPAFLPVTEEYYIHILNIQLYTSKLTGDAPCIPNFHFHHIKNLKTILNNILGIKILCKIYRAFQK